MSSSNSLKNKSISRSLGKKKIYIRILLLLLITIPACKTGKLLYEYYSPSKGRPYYKTNQNKDSTLRIAFIGDSWAYGHKSHHCHIAKLLKESIHKPIEVKSYGIGGLTSKEIYNALYEIDDFKSFIKNGYDYCVISAGINDCNKKMSTKYYKSSMNNIIQFMLYNHIRPIILEIPDYNIIEVYENIKGYKKMIQQLSMLINWTQIDCKQQFRDALIELIQEKGYQDKVSILRYKLWNNDYTNNLRTLYISDHFHLNERGYTILDSMIVKTILKDYTNNQDVISDK